MKRSVSLKWSNVWVGALILIAAAIMLWASFTGGGTSIFEPKNEFVCYFRNVEGLLVGSPIWLAGIEVGNVRDMEFVDLDSLRRVRVVGAISKKVWPMLTTEAEVLLGSIGFLGDKYIEVIPYPTKGEPLHNMDVIKTRYAGDVKAVFKEAEEAAATAGSVAVNLDSLLGRMNRGEGTLGKLSTSDQLYVNLTHLSSDLASLVADLQANQERVIGSIERLSTSVADLSEQVNSNSGTIGRLVNDPDLYENLNASTARLDSVLARINSAEGSLGLMVSDTALYVETAELLKRVNNLITDIQRNPKKYFKFSVF